MSVGPVSAVMTPPGPLIPAPSSYLAPAPGVGESQSPPCIRVLHHSQHKQLQATTSNYTIQTSGRILVVEYSKCSPKRLQKYTLQTVSHTTVTQKS